jgi:hypothetical protein
MVRIKREARIINLQRERTQGGRSPTIASEGAFNPTLDDE